MDGGETRKEIPKLTSRARPVTSRFIKDASVSSSSTAQQQHTDQTEQDESDVAN